MWRTVPSTPTGPARAGSGPRPLKLVREQAREELNASWYLPQVISIASGGSSLEGGLPHTEDPSGNGAAGPSTSWLPKIPFCRGDATTFFLVVFICIREPTILN